MGFAVIRVAAGAAVLVLLALVQRRRLPLMAPGRATGVLSLCLISSAFPSPTCGSMPGSGR